MAIAINTTETSGWRRSVVTDASSNTTITGSLPTGVTDGELLIAICQTNAATNPGTITVPSGWTEAATNSASNGSFQINTSVAWRIASSEPASYDWGVTASVADDSVTILRVTGHDASTPIDAVSTFNGASATSFTNNAITTATANAVALWIIGARNGSYLSGTDTGYPSGTTGLFSRSSRVNSNAVNTGVAYETIGTAGSTGTRAWSSYLTTNAYGSTVGIAIRPATSTAPTLTDVDGDETVTSTQTGVVFTGTGFGASQGSSTLKLKYNTLVSITLSPSAWADTSITADIVRTSGGVSLPYGAIDAEVATADGSDTLAITHVPPDARSYVTLTSLATEGKRITAVGMAIGDQLEATSVTGGSIDDVTLNADGTFDNAIGVTSFTVRGWDATDGTLGSEGTQSLVTVSEQGTEQGNMQAAARSAASTTLTFNGDMIAWADLINGDSTGTYNERLIRALQTSLGSASTNLPQLMAEAAADRGVSKWQEIGSGLTSIST